MHSYIVIEIREKDNALDIMNTLMTHTKAKFTLTNDIKEYAMEREKLHAASGSTSSHDDFTTHKKGSTDVEESRNSLDIYIQDSPPRKRHAEHDEERKPESFYIPPLEPPQQHSYSAPDYYRGFENDEYQGVPGDRIAQIKAGGIQSFKCEICHSHIRARGLDYYKRSAHAIIHTDIYRFHCKVEGCHYKVRHRTDMSRHIKVVHNITQVRGSIRDTITEDQRQQLREMVNTCFPEMINRHINKRFRYERKDESDGEQDGEEDDDDNDEDTTPKA